MDKYEVANKFWEAARAYVMKVAEEHDLGCDLTGADSFLFDLFDGGDYWPSDEEIAEAVRVYF